MQQAALKTTRQNILVLPGNPGQSARVLGIQALRRAMTEQRKLILEAATIALREAFRVLGHAQDVEVVAFHERPDGGVDYVVRIAPPPPLMAE